MFFYLSKILAFLLNPLVWVIVLFVYGIVTKNAKLKKYFLIGSCSALYLFSNSFFVDECMRAYEYTSEDFKKTEKYEWAVILGGMITYDERLEKPQFHRSADRFMQVLPLLREGNVKKILISGGSGSILLQEQKEAEIIKKYLLEIGIPDSVIFIEKKSKNTRENALFTSEFFNENYPKEKFLLVTSAFHMRRAMACFTKVGLSNFRPFCTDRFSGPRKFQLDHCFLPNPEALANFTLLVHEFSGYWVYRIAGYL